jgi:hypothetical protein
MIMKKIFKYISVLAATAIAAVSCNVDAVSTIFDESTVANSAVNAAFVQDVVVDNEIPASVSTYNIPMSRSSAAKEVTVNLTTTLDAAIGCPTSVTFAAGEFEKDLVLDLTNMSVGKTFKGKIEIVVPEDDNNTFSKLSVDCTLAKAYTWVNIGEGEFYDGLALQPSDTDLGIIKVKIDQAEGFDRWRIYNPFPKDNVIAAWAESYYVGGATEVIEVWANNDEGNTVSFSPTTWVTGLIYASLGTDKYIYEYLPSAYASSLAAHDANNCFVDENKKVIQFYLAQVIENSTSWFGEGAKYLSLPGGPDLETLLSE